MSGSIEIFGAGPRLLFERGNESGEKVGSGVNCSSQDSRHTWQVTTVPTLVFARKTDWVVV
ncbi:hypothetical protein GC163_10615 [bacterium]|nr:hypothetical protein [bacterium]